MGERRWLYFAVGILAVTCFAAGAWAGDGVVALQTAEPSCADNSGNIYVDCNNGTVTDNRTGLVWLAKANCFGGQLWPEAMEIVSGLADLNVAFCVGKGLTGEQCDCGLSDGSSPGEWRLPTVEEWETMVSNALGGAGNPDCTGTPPTITDDTGDFCYLAGSSFGDVMVGDYWSSSTEALVPSGAWVVSLSTGQTTAVNKREDLAPFYVWPVRGGQ